MEMQHMQVGLSGILVGDMEAAGAVVARTGVVSEVVRDTAEEYMGLLAQQMLVEVAGPGVRVAQPARTSQTCS